MTSLSPPAETTWFVHLVVKDLFWEKVRQVPVEAEVPFENRGSDRGVQHLQTLLCDHDEGHGVTIPPKNQNVHGAFRGSLRGDQVLVESSKAQRVQDVRRKHSSPTVYGEVFGRFGHPEAHSIRHVHGGGEKSGRSCLPRVEVVVKLTYVHGHLGRILPVSEDMAMFTGLSIFDNYHAMDVLSDEGDRLVEELQDSMAKAKYASNKGTYLSWVKYFKDGAGRAAHVSWLSFLPTGSPTLCSRAHQKMG